MEESIDLPLTKEQLLTLQEMKPRQWYYCNKFTDFMRSLENRGLVESGENHIMPAHPAWRITATGINAAKFDRGWIDCLRQTKGQRQ